MRGAITVLTGIFHIDGDAGKIFDHDFASQAGVAARSAGSDDQLLEGQQRTLDGVQFAREKNVIPQMLIDSLGNGLRLFVDLPAHGMGKIAGRKVGTRLGRVHGRLRRG